MYQRNKFFICSILWYSQSARPCMIHECHNAAGGNQDLKANVPQPWLHICLLFLATFPFLVPNQSLNQSNSSFTSAIRSSIVLCLWIPLPHFCCSLTSLNRGLFVYWSIPAFPYPHSLLSPLLFTQLLPRGSFPLEANSVHISVPRQGGHVE